MSLTSYRAAPPRAKHSLSEHAPVSDFIYLRRSKLRFFVAGRAAPPRAKHSLSEHAPVSDFIYLCCSKACAFASTGRAALYLLLAGSKALRAFARAGPRHSHFKQISRRLGKDSGWLQTNANTVKEIRLVCFLSLAGLATTYSPTP